jgi:D-3-phosphoglycerate dehydrogenase / 2-oxoglutarate reductase
VKGQTTGLVLVTVAPFGEIDRDAIDLLQTHGISFSLNELGRRLTEDELFERIGPHEVLVASTEPITERVLDAAPNLRLIARVGIGLDNLPLEAARQRGISVTYTPDAQTAAVAELTIAQMLALMRHTIPADRGMHQGLWRRRIGRSFSGMTIGVIGVGRVGRSVIRRIQAWPPARILTNDLVIDEQFCREMKCEWTDVHTIYRESDVITLHLPLTEKTRRMIGANELALMKENAILLNTSRGGIVDEGALAASLRARPAFSAAVDVFVTEPYSGELTLLENCLLSCHMGAATRESRLKMEMEATEEVIRYFKGEPFRNPVPEYEYRLQSDSTGQA